MEVVRSMGERDPGIRVVARVFILNEHAELLLLKNRTGRIWVPPGGTLELGETLVAAAAREAREEVGIDVTVGRLAAVREFRPAHRPEQVVELDFLARATRDQPGADEVESGRVEPGGGPNRPWQTWFIRDVDGLRREVRWFTREQLAAAPEPVVPALLRDHFWDLDWAAADPYLGLEEAR